MPCNLIISSSLNSGPPCGNLYEPPMFNFHESWYRHTLVHIVNTLCPGCPTPFSLLLYSGPISLAKIISCYSFPSIDMFQPHWPLWNLKAPRPLATLFPLFEDSCHPHYLLLWESNSYLSLTFSKGIWPSNLNLICCHLIMINYFPSDHIS